MTGGSALSITCLSGTTQWGTCAPGQVTFTGTNYPETVHVSVVRQSDGQVYDNADYNSIGGVLMFTETLVPAAQYSITITANNSSVTQTVTTGYDLGN
jgi:hypothetical protein